MSYRPVIGRLVKVSDPHQTTYYLVNSKIDELAIGFVKLAGLVAEGQHIDVREIEGGELNKMFLGEVRITRPD
jgi:hypothetical protein